MNTGASLSIKHLEIRDSYGTVLVDDVSLEVRPGEIVFLQGRSGVGKTLSALSVMGLLPSSLKISRGEIWLDGSEISHEAPGGMDGRRRHSVSMVFQDPKASFNPLRSIGEEIEDVLRIHSADVSQARRRSRVYEVLKEFGFDDPERILRSFVHELSGGQSQKCLIASAFLSDSRLLIADEPTGSLDAASSVEVMDLLKRMNEAQGLSILVITHDREAALKYAQKVITVSGGAHPTMLVARASTQNNHDVKEMQLEEDEITSKVQFPLGGQCVRVRNLTKTYTFPGTGRYLRHRHSVVALNGFSMELGKGEILGIVGRSGCGKTTLAKCLLGLTNWDEGYVEINEMEVPSEIRPQRSAELGIQMIWQHPFSSLNPAMRVRDILLESLRRREDKAETRIRDALEEVELPRSFLNRRPFELSGGECQRVAIAAVLLLRPRILIADEALSFLDFGTKLRVTNLLKRLQIERNLAMLFISHDSDIVDHVCDRVVRLS
jgi:peptide/nickel transport system ATP-binding protein